MKKQSVIRILFLSLFLLPLAGCDSNEPDEPEDIVGSFSIEITGDVMQTINGGQAAFGAASDAQTGITGFGLSLGNTNGGTTAQSLIITRKGDRPGNGSHSIANFDLTSQVESISDDEFIAIYSSGTDVFYANGGSLTITESSGTRLAGNINLTAESVLPESSAQITISGSFTAIGLDVVANQ